ncbi:hypothetical protein BDW22DRAFT_1431472 [Trametopsis cervina]|nr:hypothetical protein BDW22DRAFT_1431472 [Trametopsis cervina]
MPNFACTRSGLRNTDVLDEQGTPLYRISTDHALLGREHTKVSSLQSGEPGETVAEVEWQSAISSTITFKIRGTSIKARDFTRHSSLSSARAFNGYTGRSYSWEVLITGAKLQSVPEGQKIGEWHSKSHGIIGHAHPAHLELPSDATEDLVEIVLVLLYVQELSRQDPLTGAAYAW